LDNVIGKYEQKKINLQRGANVKVMSSGREPCRHMGRGVVAPCSFKFDTGWSGVDRFACSYELLDS
jgi:hypothetical protein